jgi:hypothetical protein
MSFGCRSTRSARLPLTAVTVLGITAAAHFTAAVADGAAQAAVWAPKEVVFQYVGFTTKYSCDALQAKMKRLLLKLGARDDLRVTSYGCTRLSGPDPLAGVRIKMNVLQPAAAASAQAVSANWKSVDLLANRDPFDAAADCELIDQIEQKVLPLFTTRNVDYAATCARRQIVIGSTHLKADVLTTAPGAALASLVP